MTAVQHIESGAEGYEPGRPPSSANVDKRVCSGFEVPVEVDALEQPLTREVRLLQREAQLVDLGGVLPTTHRARRVCLRCGDGPTPLAVRHRRAVESSPAVVDGTVYVGSIDSRVYALTDP